MAIGLALGSIFGGGIGGQIAGSVLSSVATSALSSFFGGEEGGGSAGSVAAMKQTAFNEARKGGREARSQIQQQAGERGSGFMNPEEKVQAKEEPTESIEKIIQRLTGLTPKQQNDYATHYHNNLPEKTKQIMLEDRIQRAIEEDDIEFADNLIEHNDIFFRHDDDDDDSTSKPKPMSVKDYFDMAGDYEI